jgi:hypothetical protein
LGPFPTLQSSADAFVEPTTLNASGAQDLQLGPAPPSWVILLSDAQGLGFHAVELLDGAVAAGAWAALIPPEPFALTVEVA